MAEYHVGCGLAGIYAGTIKKPVEWKSKSEVTDEALRSVAEYMLGQLKPGDQAYEESGLVRDLIDTQKEWISWHTIREVSDELEELYMR